MSVLVLAVQNGQKAADGTTSDSDRSTQSSEHLEPRCIVCQSATRYEMPLFRCTEHHRFFRVGEAHVCAAHAIYGEQIPVCDDAAIFCPSCAAYGLRLIAYKRKQWQIEQTRNSENQ